MNTIQIEGGISLEGEATVQGSKNAALPVLAASVLVPGISVYNNCPKIADVFCMLKILQSVGCQVNWDGNTVIVDASHITRTRLPAEYVIQMRSSIILMGAILARMGEVSLDYPGGCVIGKRPIDLHLSVMRSLGAKIEEKDSILTARGSKLKGSCITLRISSVGATENAILAAVMAEGDTLLFKGAKEPEILALCDFLRTAGGEIAGDGGEVLHIKGGTKFHSAVYDIPPDRIVAGTYLLAVMACGGKAELHHVNRKEMTCLLKKIEAMGGRLRYDADSIQIERIEKPKSLSYIRTEGYPGFPTDLQSQLLSVLSIADGVSTMEENIFENRFRIVSELKRMGANIQVFGKRALVQGVKELHGTQVLAEELRGGAALILAGLAATGITTIGNRHFIDRGYENIQRDLRQLGAHVAGEVN